MNAAVPAPRGTVAADITWPITRGDFNFLTPLKALVLTTNLANRIQYLGDSRYRVLLFRDGLPDYQDVTFNGDFLAPEDGLIVNGSFWALLVQRAYCQQQGVDYRNAGAVEELTLNVDPHDAFLSLTGRDPDYHRAS